MSNRLAEAMSPYLLQHKDNPVDWYEWGAAAFDEARRRDAPVLLSVGYAACHWCHVMAHESFEDGPTAAEMNAGFVNVKVDREERPDVDAVYMQATTALTGHGGWPMTVFLTPDGRPFYAGTYFPPVPLHGRPSFRQVLAAVTDAWTSRRAEVEHSGTQISSELASNAVAAGRGSVLVPKAPTAEQLVEAVRSMAGAEDVGHGGFGGAPKFPPSMVLEFLLRHAASEHGLAAGTAQLASDVASRCLTAMAHSGMYDQLAGGFARYSVDAAWVVPHFEKMLYDNAQLARVYLHWWRLTGDPIGRRVAEETCDWMLAALGTGSGALASSLDADTPVQGAGGAAHGEEGLTYVWTPAELVDVLGWQDGPWAAELLGVTSAGTFERGSSTLRLTRDVWAGPAGRSPVGTDGERERWRRVRSQLLAHRGTREQPRRDDKVVLAWNGLAAAALAEVGALCGREDLVAAATACADVLLSVHLGDDGSWRRVSRDGVPGAPAAVLEDLGDLAEGLLCLHAVTGEAAWAAVAGAALDQVLADFGDSSGGFFDTGVNRTDAELAVVGRPSDPSDNAYPSGTSAAAAALVTYAALTGSTRHRKAAESALAAAAALAGPAPRFAGWGLAAAEALLDGPREVAVLGARGHPATRELHVTALLGTAPGLVVAVGEADAPDAVELLRNRPTVGGVPAAYVCRGFVCAMPTTEPAVLADQVQARQVPGDEAPRAQTELPDEP